MKKIAFLFLFFASGACICSLSAQNFRSFYTATENYFHGSPGFLATTFPLGIPAPVYVLKADSVSLQGSDFVFHLQKNFRGEFLASGCLDDVDTGMGGAKVIQLANGFDVFFNQNGDSIKILTSALANQTFTMYTFANGDYYEGTMTGLTLTFLPVAGDSIKVFSFQRKNFSGTNVADPFNGLEVYISKNYGIIQTYDWLRFPYEISPYQLVGSVIAGTGIDNLTAAEIFDFNIGDDFHYFQDQPSFIGPGSSYTKIWQEKKVISKYISVNTDTVIYGYDTKTQTEYYTTTPFSMTPSYLHDTTFEQVILPGNLLNEYSMKFGNDSNFSFSNPWYADGPFGYNAQHNPGTYNNRELKTKYTDFNYSADCFQEALMTCYHASTFGKGIGFVERTTVGLNTCTIPVSLVYYSKGAETWGTPIDWNTWLGYNENEKNKIVLSAFPNPAKNSVNFSFAKSTEGKIEIFNSLGEKISERKISGSALSIDLSTEIAGGIYFYRFVSVEGKTASGKFVRE